MAVQQLLGSYEGHIAERAELLEGLQNLPLVKGQKMRVTFLSGDIHQGELGTLLSNSKFHLPIQKDWRYMPQLVSSAIGNRPAPMFFCQLLETAKSIVSQSIDEDTSIAWREWQQVDDSKYNFAIIAHRNYLSIMETDSDNLVANLHIEWSGQSGKFEMVQDIIPELTKHALHFHVHKKKNWFSMGVIVVVIAIVVYYAYH